MWQKQLKTTLQDVLGQLLKYGVVLSSPRYCARARDLSRVCIHTLLHNNGSSFHVSNSEQHINPSFVEKM